MASRLYPDWMIGALAGVAVGGWLVAWSVGGGDKNEGAGKDVKVSAAERSGGRVNGKGSPLSFISDGDTARLLASFESIQAGAVDGEPNKKLIHAARGVLLDGNVQRRARNYSLLLELMRPEDGPALHEQFLELHREGKTYDEYKTLAGRWGQLDARGAIKYLSSQVPMRFPGDDFRAIARGWALEDPKDALAWVEDHPDMARQMNARATIVEGWMREDPAGALKWVEANLSSLEGMDYFEVVRLGFGGQINGESTAVEDAIAWLRDLPPSEMKAAAASHAWYSLQWAMGEMPYDKAASVWGKVVQEEWANIDQFADFSHAISGNRVADQGMQGFLAELEKTWPKEEISSRFARWTTENPQRTLNWLSQAPPSPVTQAALQGAVSALQDTNPEVANALLERIESGGE